MKEYYSRLYLHEGSSKEEVKVAYRKLVKKFHPDKNQESNDYSEEFKLIQEAYEKLINYIEQKENPTKSYEQSTEVNPSKSQYAESGSNEVIKSKSKFAEEAKPLIKEDVIIKILLLVFFLVSIYALLDMLK